MIGNANSIVQHVLQIRIGIIKRQCECKNCEKDNSWSHSTCICENSKYLRSVADTSVSAMKM